MGSACQFDGKNRVMFTLDHISGGIVQVDQEVQVSFRDASGDGYDPGKVVGLKHSHQISSNGSVGESCQENPVGINVVTRTRFLD